MSGRFFVFGLGFSARVIARALLDAGWEVRGTTRSGEAAELPGVKVYAFDRDHPLPAEALEGVDAVLSSVPPDTLGDPVLDLCGDQLRALAPRWTGYLSTTGIYGDHDGALVTEDTPPAPNLERSRRRLAAEQAWQASGLAPHLFRLAGIYGPGRSAIDTVRDGRARRIVKPGQVFSRIHVDDIAACVLASLAHPYPGGRVYNLCDDDPAPPQDVIAYACDLLGVTPPPEIGWDEAKDTLSPMALSFYADNKLVSNDRIKRELGVELRHPSYRDGLRAILNLG